MTDLRKLATDLIAASEAATPGPWWITHVYAGEGVLRGGDPPQAILSGEDDEFIVLARNTAPEIAKAYLAALDRLEKAEAVVEAARSHLKIDNAPDYGEKLKSWNTLIDSLAAFDATREGKSDDI